MVNVGTNISYMEHMGKGSIDLPAMEFLGGYRCYVSFSRPHGREGVHETTPKHIQTGLFGKSRDDSKDLPRYDSSDSQESNVPQSHSLSVSPNRGKAVKQQAGGSRVLQVF